MANENEVIIRLIGKGENFEDMIRNATGSWSGFLKSFMTGPGVIVAAATGIFTLAKHAAKAGEELNILSEKTGMSVENLSLLKYAAEQGDTNINALADGIKFLSKNMLEAASGNEKAATAFKALGLNVDELLKMKPEDRMLAMADAISRVQDPALKSTLAIETMGRGAVELLPFLSQGAAGIVAFMEKAKEMGLQIGTEQAKHSEEFNKAMETLIALVDKAAIDIGMDFIPVLKGLTDILIGLWKFIKSSLILAMDVLVLAFEALATSIAFAQHGIAKLTDLLGLTRNESKATARQLDYYKSLTTELARKTAESFNTLISSTTGAAHAEEKLGAQIKDNVNLTDEQRKKILARAAAEKLAAELAKGHAEANKILSEGYLDYCDRILNYKKSIGVYDDEYFNWYKNKLQAQGYDEKQIAAMVAKEKKEKLESHKELVVTTDDLIKTSAQGVADTLKLLWSDQETTFKDAWQNALNKFIDVLAQMVINAIISSKAIQIEMAAATAGISLVLGMIAAVFSKGKHGKSAVQQATEDFLRNLKQALEAWEDQVLSTLEKLTKEDSGINKAFETIVDAVNLYYKEVDNAISAVQQRTFLGNSDAYIKSVKATWSERVRGMILPVMDEIKDAIVERYDLEKQLIGEVFDLLKRQQDFVKNIDKTIIDVTRSTFSKEELFAAQRQDIQDVFDMLSGAAGEERIDIAGQLKEAYLAYWETGKELLSGDALVTLQNFVLAGLNQAKQVGVSAYDQLIDVNLDMLGVQTRSADLAAQMTGLLGEIKGAMYQAFDLLKAMATAPGDQLPALIESLSLALKTLGVPLEVPQFATGAYVTRPTLAMIGEAKEAEWVLPDSKLRGLVGMGGGNSFSFSFPNITSFGDLTVDKAKQLLRGVFGKAAQDLGREGYSWGMQPRSSGTSF